MDTGSDTEKEAQTTARLLQRFAAGGDRVAFEGLVGRHAAMVRGVALRCTGDAALADEVTQSVFTLLARRAASIPGEHLGGWLHTTAFLTASNARRRSLRYRRALEDLAGHTTTDMETAVPDPAFHGSPWEDIRAHLDEAVAKLPEKARRPVILRFFESMSVREIAAATGRNEKAVSKALERSLQRLSGILRRRGITTTGSALAAMLSAESLLAPPASAATLTAAALQSASSITAISAAVPGASLLSKTIITMTTVQTVTTASAAVILALVPAVYFWRETTVLRQKVRELRAAAIHSGPAAPRPQPVPPPGGGVVARPKPAKAEIKPAASPADAGAAALAALFSPETLLKRAAADIEKNTAQEVERISLYLPDLTDAQKERALTALREDSKGRVAHMEKALKSGAYERVMKTPEKATAEDRALMAAAAPSGLPVPENDPLASILTGEQFELYRQKQEEKRVSEAEASAGDTLKILNAGMDLSPEQKDRIFEELGQLQMGLMDPGDGQPGNAFLDQKLRDAERERIIKESLTPRQSELFDKRMAELKQGLEKLFKGAKPAEGGK